MVRIGKALCQQKPLTNKAILPLTKIDNQMQAQIFKIIPGNQLLHKEDSRERANLRIITKRRQPAIFSLKQATIKEIPYKLICLLNPRMTLNYH